MPDFTVVIKENELTDVTISFSNSTHTPLDNPTLGALVALARKGKIQIQPDTSLFSAWHLVTDMNSRDWCGLKSVLAGAWAALFGKLPCRIIDVTAVTRPSVYHAPKLAYASAKWWIAMVISNDLCCETS